MTGQRFEGKVAIVTGGGVGIGRTIAEQMCAEGAAVVVADITRVNGEAAVRDLNATGYRATYVEMDLGRVEDAERTVAEATKQFGRVDILVNCAAFHGRLVPILETTNEDWEKVFRVNVMGTFALTQAAVKQMLLQGDGGAVVNVLAIQAYSPLPTYGPYASSKGALVSMTHSLAVELADKGIRVNGIAVGSVYSETAARALGGDPAAVDAMAAADDSAATLVGRMGRTEDIARVACFLASEDASYIAGAVIPADGGRLISRKSDPFLNAVVNQSKAK